MAEEFDDAVLKVIPYSPGTIYAQDIIDQVNLGSEHHAGFGNVYPALNRLEKQGLIIKELEDAPPPRRAFYSRIRGAKKAYQPVAETGWGNLGLSPA